MSEYINQRLESLEVSYPLVALLSLTVLFQVGAATIAQALAGYSPEPTQTADLTISLRLAGIVIVESLLLVALWRLYTRLSGFWQKAIKWAIIAMIFVTEYALIYVLFGTLWVVLGILGGTSIFLVYKYTSVSEFTWVLFNTVAVGGGILFTALFGVMLAPPVVIAVMTMLLLWDKLAVDLTDIMGDLVNFSASVSIPNFVIIPSKLRFELKPVREFMADPDKTDRPESISLVLGVGDLLFPALLTASAVVAYPDLWPSYGAFIGTLFATVVLIAELNVRESGAPALLWVNPGAIGGFAVGMVPVIL